MKKNLPLFLAGFCVQLPAPCTFTLNTLDDMQYECAVDILNAPAFEHQEILPPTDPSTCQYESKRNFYLALINAIKNKVSPDWMWYDINLIYNGGENFSLLRVNNNVEQTRHCPPRYCSDPLLQLRILQPIIFGSGTRPLCLPYVFGNSHGTVVICGYLLPKITPIAGEEEYKIYSGLPLSSKSEWQRTNPLYPLHWWERYYDPDFVREIQEIIKDNKDKAYTEIIQSIQEEYNDAEYSDTITKDIQNYEIISIQINEHKIPFGIEFLCMARNMSDEDKEQLLVNATKEILTNHFAARIHSQADLEREVRVLFASKIPA